MGKSTVLSEVTRLKMGKSTVHGGTRHVLAIWFCFFSTTKIGNLVLFLKSRTIMVLLFRNKTVSIFKSIVHWECDTSYVLKNGKVNSSLGERDTSWLYGSAF